MSKEKKSTVTGEQILKTVTEQLITSLTSLKAQLGEKKFNKRIKKAAKLLIEGIEKKPVKSVIPKSAKKLVVKVAKPVKAKPVKKKVAKPAAKKAK
jgi:hypothetical protein